MDLKQPLKLLGEDIVQKIIAVLTQKDKIVTGKLRASINSRVLTIVDDISFQLQILDDSGYFKDQDEGRRPGKRPAIKKIEQWTKLRGIPKEAAWPIAINIGKFGLPANHIFDDALKALDLKSFEDAVQKEVFDQVTEQIMAAYRQKEA